MKSLYDSLDIPDPRVADPAETELGIRDAIDVTDPQEFCRLIVRSREFKQYVVNGFVLGDIPSAIACRIMDHAWGKPVERVEVNNTSELENLTPAMAVEKLERVQHMLELLRRAQLEDDGDVVSVH